MLQRKWTDVPHGENPVSGRSAPAKVGARGIVAATLVLLFVQCAVSSEAATPIETVRIATPGKLIDFAALYAGAHLGIYRQEGLDPQFIVMRSGIILQALAAGEIDYTTLL